MEQQHHDCTHPRAKHCLAKHKLDAMLLFSPTSWLYYGGFTDAAQHAKERTLEMVDREGFWEYYNPFTGKGLGTFNFGWSSLVIDMIHRDYEKKTVKI